MSDIDKPLPNDAPNVTLTIRMIMTGKEVGSIIGKGGEIINNIREESSAKIHISDGSVPERIVTVTGSTDAILKAFGMICKKLEDDGPPREGGSGGASTSTSKSGSGGVTLRMIVPASQCGSLIGKGGSKIKEIREVTGASIQVASEMLPNSTERSVTISGPKDAITQCIYHICCVMLESPPKGTPIPYTPKAGGSLMSGVGHRGSHHGGRGGPGGVGVGGGENPLAVASLLSSLGGGAGTLAALATLAGSQMREGGGGGGGGRDGSREHDRSPTQTHEMSIPNELIGCIIGKGGSKIAEIRQISGAMIRISKSDEGGSVGGGDGGEGASASGSERQITISGHPDSVALAKSLINMSLDIHKSKLEDRDRDGGGGSNSRERDHDRHHSRDRYGGGGRGGGLGALGGGSGVGDVAALGSLAQLLTKPEALTALTTLAGLNSLGGIGGNLLGGGGGGAHGFGGHQGMQVTGVHRSRGGYGAGGSRSSRDDDRGSRDSKRSKFAPY